MSNWKIKYRPEVFEDFAGNDESVDTITNDLSGEDRQRAYLISGPHGVGKTTLARIAAVKFLGADEFNITEINAASDNGIAMSRELQKHCGVFTSNNRVWILDEFHEATKAAQNSLLKLLEEGSSHDHFFLCTTDPSKIIPTIKSRCGKYPLELAESIAIKRRLRQICKAEGVKVSPEVTQKILDKAEGHVRDAVGLLQSVHKMDEEKALKYLDKVQGGEANSPEAYELVKSIYSGKNAKIKILLKEMKSSGENPEGLRRFILSYGTTMLLNRWEMNIAAVMANFEEPYFDAPTAWPKFVLDCYRSTVCE